MKTVFFASAAAAALIAAPAFAQDTAGSVGVSYQYSDTDIGAVKGIEQDTFAIDGVVATPIFGDWTVTGAAATTYSDGDAFAKGETTLSGSAALTKVIGTYRVGGFYAAEEFQGSTLNTFGAVAQKYFDKATVTGTASYGSVYDADIWSVKADVAYYATDALRLNAGVGYSNNEDAYGFDADAVELNVGAEYQFAASPYSVFAGYTYADSDDLAVEANAIKVGVRYNFGGNLQARDRAGAGLGL